jgi:hypothetical protein
MQANSVTESNVPDDALRWQADGDTSYGSYATAQMPSFGAAVKHSCGTGIHQPVASVPPHAGFTEHKQILPCGA